MNDPQKPNDADMAVDLVVPGDIDGSSTLDLEAIIRRLRYAEPFVERCRVLEERYADLDKRHSQMSKLLDQSQWEELAVQDRLAREEE